VKCPFCATGTVGFKRNLSADEIIEQVLLMQHVTGERIDNLVFMGQGEPLNNYDNVVESINKFRHLVGIGVRHITVSTSGVVPAMLKLADEGLQVNLALSLHDPDDADRDYLVPINKKWPVKEVIAALQNYVDKTNRRVTIEYAMLRDRNDSQAKAEMLGQLVKHLHCNINLIPYNTTDVTDPFQRSSDTTIRAFAQTLETASRNKTVTTRRERGHDIDAACGQLANK
jgi:23S rRNA (adenine2503-C2)-methyltransferase